MTGNWPVLFLFSLRAVAGMHGVAFGGAGFVNDALEQTPDRGVGQWPCIVALSVCEHFVFPVRLVQRYLCLLLELADFEGAVRALVQELDELLVDFIDAAAPVAEVHGATSRRERPWRAASLNERTRYASAGDEIEKTGGAGGDFRKSLVRGSRRTKKNRVEMMGGENAAILFGFFGREISGEDAVGACRRGRGCEFFKAHLQDGIVIAEKDQRDL